jgi:hypothetical protein
MVSSSMWLLPSYWELARSLPVTQAACHAGIIAPARSTARNAYDLGSVCPAASRCQQPHQFLDIRHIVQMIDQGDQSLPVRFRQRFSGEIPAAAEFGQMRFL